MICDVTLQGASLRSRASNTSIETSGTDSLKSHSTTASGYVYPSTPDDHGMYEASYDGSTKMSRSCLHNTHNMGIIVSGPELSPID